MNNKFVYCIVLFFTSSLIASEKRIEVIAYKSFIIETYRKLELKDLASLKSYGHFTLQDVREYEVNAIKRKTSDCLDIKASSLYTARDDLSITIDNKNLQSIKESYDLYKDNQKYNRLKNKDLFLYLANANSVDKKIISLKLTEDQVKEIIEKPSAMRSILISLGAAGFIAFLAYCLNLRAKGMTLLGRG